MGYATVVVGTDGSASAHAAVARAAELAAGDAALLIIVCVAGSVPARAGVAVASAEFGEPRHDQQVPCADTAREALRAAVQHAEQVGAPGVTTVLVEGDPAQGLLGVARQRGADCIVLGARGINSLSGRLLGSVPADVAYRSPCDVLIAHAAEESER